MALALGFRDHLIDLSGLVFHSKFLSQVSTWSLHFRLANCTSRLFFVIQKFNNRVTHCETQLDLMAGTPNFETNQLNSIGFKPPQFEVTWPAAQFSESQEVVGWR